MRTGVTTPSTPEPGPGDMVSDREEETVSSARRGPLRVVIAALFAATVAVLTTAPAHAAAYRFWGFYQLTEGEWAFAQKGSDQTVPADGSVDGWRFAVSDENVTRFPRGTLTFAAICGSTPASSGSKRVGLVVDYGRPADSADGTTPPAPTAVCAVVPTTATSTDVLRQAGELRTEKGLVCAVAGYPAAGCGDAVKQVSAEAKAGDTPVAIAPPTPKASAAPATVAANSTDAGDEGATSSAATTITWVVVALLLIALLVYLVARSRRRARSDA